MRSRFSGVCASFIVAIISLPVFAQQDESFWMDADRASVNIGGFAADFKTDLRLSSDALGVGTKISLEDDLGMDSERFLARIDGYYRFSRRHRIDYGLLDIDRHGSTRVQRDINVGDLVIPVNVLVESDFRMTVLKVAYTYSFFQNRTVDLGVSAGMIGLDVDANIDAGVAIGTEDAEGFAPYPVFGLRLGYAFSRKLFLKASIEYFEISSGDVEARAIDGLIALEHKTWKNVGLGGGYNVVDLEGEDTKDKDEAQLKYEGLLVYMKVYF